MIERDSRWLSGLIKIIGDNQDNQFAWKAKNRSTLYLASKKYFETIKDSFNVTHFYFHDLQGKNYLRVHHLGRFGDKITRNTLLTE